jgi:hypothetical protein
MEGDAAAINDGDARLPVYNGRSRVHAACRSRQSTSEHGCE